MADALVVTSSFLPGQGGIESYLAELCSEMAPRLAVMAPRSRDGKSLPLDLPYPTEAGPAGMLLPRPVVARAIVESARRRGTDRLLFGTPWPLVLLGPQIMRAKLRYSTIVHGAEFLVPSAVPGVSNLLADALARSEVIFAVSEYTAGRVEDFLVRRGRRIPPIEILRARIDTTRFSPEVDPRPGRDALGLAPEAKVVLCFGRIVPRKGVDRLIAAMHDIRTQVRDAVLVIAGTGPEEKKLRAFARPLGDAVLFGGRIPNELAPAVYRAADVFALAVVDRYFGLEVEGLGVVLVEAAASGVPCVTGRSGGTPEAVIDGETGFVVDATSQTALVDAIVRLLANEELARKMGGAARAHAKATFDNPDRLAPLLDWLS